jgi:hypothetical protein
VKGKLLMGKIMTGLRLWAGPILLLPTIVLWGLWIKAFGEGGNQEERVQIFLSYFPAGTTLHTLTTLPLVASISAVVLGALILLTSPRKREVNVSILVVVLGVVFTLLNIFQLL